jgi:hypothetical protein
MTAQRDALNEFLQFDKIRGYAKLVFEILPSPTQKTMDIVNNGHEVNSVAFMVFGLGVFSVTVFAQPVILTGKFSFANSMVTAILMFLSFITYAGVQYKILKDVSHANRTFDNFVVMSSLVGGMYYILVGGAFVISMFFEVIGALLLLAASVYMIVYGLRTAQAFWEISFGKIFLYSFLSGLAATILIVIVGFVFGLILGIAGVTLESPWAEARTVTDSTSNRTPRYSNPVQHYSTTCQTFMGACSIAPQPVGNSCYCFTNYTQEPILGTVQ